MAFWRFPKYVTVAEKKKKAEKTLKRLMKKDPGMKPVTIAGRALATTWWGKAWNANLEQYADYANRIGRGRSYVRHSAVLDLRVKPGRATALVQGSELKPYTVTVKIKKIAPAKWRSIKTACKGKFDSLQKLLGGKFPRALEELFTQKGRGLFPAPAEIAFSCSCPDWASMCKHVAATLYGIGARLDEDPGLFFILRNVKVADLVSETVAETSKYILQKAGRETARVMEGADLSDVFGIDMEEKAVASEKKLPARQRPKRRRSKPPARKTKPGTAGKNAGSKGLQDVENMIRKASNGITTAELVKQTGLKADRVRYFIARLRKQKRIETPRRGLYTGINAKPGRTSRLADLETVLKIINRSRKGITTATVAEKSGLEPNSVRYAIARLKAKGKIKAISRGLYKKA